MSSTRRYMRKGDNDNAVVDALLPFMHRCNSLYLSGPEHQPFIDLLSPAALVRLRSVKIEPVVGAGSYLNTWLPLRKLMAAPNLQSFCCISASPSNISITEIPLHLSPHLTHLVLQGAETPYQDVLAALQRLPELRRLGILFRHQSLTDAIVPVEVSLPSLEELIVFDYENPSRTATFLDCLTDLSSLCSLDCQTSSRLAYIVNHTLSQDANKNGFSFAAYSLLAKKIEAKNLRHLGISLNLNSDQVVGCFRMLPYIAKLDLTNCYDSARRKPFPEYFNLEPLIVQPNTPVLLPRLRFISIKNSCRITDEVVLRFIISRIQALSCSNISDGKVAVLRSFEGLFPREKQQEVMSAIKQYGSDTGIEEVPDMIKLTYIQA
ncbi:hypothetical protein CPC08DRAFT_767325 [Agrocybe pediades]|nr:hypothetical protein CPC08DRAFT_767325 [Agrocybe pediades]